MFFFASLTFQAVLSRGNPAANVPVLDMLPISSEAPRDSMIFSIEIFSRDLRIVKPVQAAKECKIERAKETAFILNKLGSLSLSELTLWMAKLEIS